MKEIQNTKEYSEVRQLIVDLMPDEDEVVFLEPEYLDDAIVGLSLDRRVIYSYKGLIQAYMNGEGWDLNTAVEWVEFNTLRAMPYAGNRSPLVIHTITDFKDDL